MIGTIDRRGAGRVAVLGALGALGAGLWVAPAVAGVGPGVLTVSGTVAVGSTITITANPGNCDVLAFGVTVEHGTDEGLVPVGDAATPGPGPVPASVQFTIPDVDQTAVPIVEGSILVIEGSGTCTSPDGFQVGLGSIEVIVGASVQATTTTTTAPPETTTTAPPAPATTQPPAAAPAQELPRTGGGNRSAGMAGATLLAAGAVVVAAARGRAAA